MANTKDLRNKIVSVKNTQQTTRAMKMVSAAQLRRAQHAITNARPYALKLRTVIHKIAQTQTMDHKYLYQPEVTKRVLMVVMTSDRGLCGSFNSNVLKYADRFVSEAQGKYEKVDVFCLGRRAGDFFRRKGLNPVDTIINMAKNVSYEMAQGLASRLLKWFESGEYDEVQIVYNEFKSAISQKVCCEKLLPLSHELSEQEEAESESSQFGTDIVFEPAPQLIMDQLLQKHFAVQVYRCMQESIASEHGARMNAMENATKNAGEMIRNLTLSLNKIRQASITTELIEITSGAQALES